MAGMSNETQAGAAFGEQLLRQAAIEGIHPEIFVCRVIGHVLGATLARCGRDRARGMMASLSGALEDIGTELGVDLE